MIRRRSKAGGKVLFISHNAGRNGAPLMLLNLLRWLREHTDLGFEVLLRGPGPLQEAFAALAPTHLYAAPSPFGNPLATFARKLGCGGLRKKSHRQNLLRHLRSTGISVLYSNTVTNGDILEILAPLEAPVITHVHEMEGWIQQAGAENLRRILHHTSHFIAASGACMQNLVENHGLSPEKVEVVHSFIPSARAVEAQPSGVRHELGIPDDAFVILGSGHEAWRKGKDLFVQLAARLQRSQRERSIHFLWVGGWLSETDRRSILHDVTNLGLEGQVHFVGEVSNPLDYFAAGDLFALVSREDTFPLVCLEAAALGKPVLCFAGAGGMPEFVEEDAGFVVPYLDLGVMAERIVELAADTATRHRLGERAARKVRELYDVETGSKRIESIIRDTLLLLKV